MAQTKGNTFPDYTFPVYTFPVYTWPQTPTLSTPTPSCRTLIISAEERSLIIESCTDGG